MTTHKNFFLIVLLTIIPLFLLTGCDAFCLDEDGQCAAASGGVHVGPNGVEIYLRIGTWNSAHYNAGHYRDGYRLYLPKQYRNVLLDVEIEDENGKVVYSFTHQIGQKTVELYFPYTWEGRVATVYYYPRNCDIGGQDMVQAVFSGNSYTVRKELRAKPGANAEAGCEIK